MQSVNEIWSASRICEKHFSSEIMQKIHAENDSGRLDPDLFLFLKKLYLK